MLIQSSQSKLVKNAINSSQNRAETMWVEEKEVMRPWGKVGIDLFSLEGKNYVLLMDYYSHYPASFAEGHSS